MLPCGKRTFRDELAATAEATYMAQIGRAGEKGSINVYFCRACDGWHWGHTDQKRKERFYPPTKNSKT